MENADSQQRLITLLKAVVLQFLQNIQYNKTTTEAVSVKISPVIVFTIAQREQIQMTVRR